MTLGAAVIATAGPSLFVNGASAQSWLPWTTREEPRRPQPPRQPPPRNDQFQKPYNNNAQGYGVGKAPICLQLEQRLAQDAQRQANSQGTIQNLKNAYNEALRTQRRAERELDRQNCYETFLFTRSLRPSQVCRRFDTEARQSGRRVEELSLVLRDVRSGGNQERRDEIVRALARNNCGESYQRDARRRDPLSNLWQDNDGDGARGPGNLFGGLPFATYRTVCVRLCDGYYFPVSFSTLPNHFQRDTEACRSKCAAPTELYFHQNPGGSVDQMVSQSSQQPYTSLRTAFRYRKEYVAGCSCKETEYVPQQGATGRTVQTPPAPTGQPRAAQQNNQLSPMR